MLGWFKFQDSGREFKHFTDEIYDKDTQRIIDKPQEFGCTINVDKAHTLVNYSFILNNGLVSYERKILSELETEPDNEYLNAMKKSLIMSVYCSDVQTNFWTVNLRQHRMKLK